MNKKVFAFLNCIYMCCSANPEVRNCGKSNSQPKTEWSIVGGEETRPGDYPWIVSLQYVDDDSRGNNHFCAGSVISEKWILTAAHCTDGSLRPSDIQAVVGLYKLSDILWSPVQILKISEIVMHEDYDIMTVKNDIALLKTVEPIDIYGPSGSVNVICLPLKDSEPYGLANVIGWGQVSYPDGPFSDILMEVTVPIIPKNTCDEIFGNLSPTMMCAGMENKDACASDSGGPLFQTDEGVSTLIGIVSFGIGCGDKDYPGVYTNVSAYIPWIENTIK